MISQPSMKHVLYLSMLALLLACCLYLLFPASSYAHAFLTNSDLASGTVWLRSSSAGSTGQMDGATIFRLVMIILVNLSAVFWVGAQLWHAFVFQSTNASAGASTVPKDDVITAPRERIGPDSTGQMMFDRDCEQRFTHRFALPVLLLLFVASIGVLIGQGLLVSNGRFDQATSPALLTSLASSGQFGLYWSLQEVFVLLALALAIYALVRRKPSLVFTEVQSWVNLLIALALLFVMTSLDHTVTTATIPDSSFTPAILSGWLYLLAVSLWVGGIFYLSLVCLPLLRRLPLQEQAPMLLKTLMRFSPLAIVGIILMVVTGVLNATVNMTSLNQLWQTAYGRSLLIEIFLVGCLLLANAVHVFSLHSYVAKTTKICEMAKIPATRSEVLEHVTVPISEVHPPKSPVAFSASEPKQIEGSMAVQNGPFRMVRWESLLGVGILICMGLLTVFSSALQPAITLVPKNQAAQIKPFTATLKTTDHAYTLQLQVAPNHIGNNVFTIHVLDKHNQGVSNVDITIYPSMLDMDMGVDTVRLQESANGIYSAPYQFTMAGGWQLLIKVRAPDSTIHETTIDLNTPF